MKFKDFFERKKKENQLKERLYRLNKNIIYKIKRYNLYS